MLKRYRFKREDLALPYAVFLVIFVVLPLFVIISYAFTNGNGEVSFENFAQFFRNPKTIGTLFYSTAIALLTTIFCLVLGYPVAYILAKGEVFKEHSLLFLFILPMWINFTLRITAMKEILTFFEGNLAYHPFFNTVLCMVYDFLPFMIQPIYHALTKLDDSMLEAAHDLGANQFQTILKVVLPLSVPGIVSGVTMVFLPSMTNYVVLDLVYNSTYIMGSLIGSYFSAYDWHNGSVVSLVLLLIIGIITLVSNKLTAPAGQEQPSKANRA